MSEAKRRYNGKRLESNQTRFVPIIDKMTPYQFDTLLEVVVRLIIRDSEAFPGREIVIAEFNLDEAQDLVDFLDYENLEALFSEP